MGGRERELFLGADVSSAPSNLVSSLCELEAKFLLKSPNHRRYASPSFFLTFYFAARFCSLCSLSSRGGNLTSLSLSLSRFLARPSTRGIRGGIKRRKSRGRKGFVNIQTLANFRTIRGKREKKDFDRLLVSAVALSRETSNDYYYYSKKITEETSAAGREGRGLIN